MTDMIAIRAAHLNDVPAITAIYQHYVRTHTATFEVDPPDTPEMTARMQRLLAAGLPYLVAQEGDELIGYAYAGPYRTRAAYRHTVENSVYLHPDRTGRGVGTRLLHELVRQCTDAGYREMVAIIGDSANIASIRLHTQAGFVHVGTLQRVGFKFGRWLDTVLMQKQLNAEENQETVIAKSR